MNNDQTKEASAKRSNKWLRLGRKILIGAIITWVVNFILLKTGWDSWETFSNQADQFANKMLSGAVRLSPVSLWKSITTTQKTFTIDSSDFRYFPYSKVTVTGKLSFKEKVFNWMGYYWYNEKGKPFWFGRIILFIALLSGIAMAVEDYDRAKDKLTAKFVFLFNIILKFFIFLMSLGIAALILYFIIKLLLLVLGGIVTLFSVIAASGGIIKLVFDEAKNEAAESSKKTIGSYLLPFLFRKNKSK